MSRCFLVLFLSSLTWGATRSVEIRGSEVWLITDGAATQLTNDGKAKLQAVLSPSQDRVAYYNQCPVQEHCIPSVIILDLTGRKLRSLAPHGSLDNQPADNYCTSILRIWWTKPTSIAAECHINPSLSEYTETDLKSGKTTGDLMGYWFVPSPDGNLVGHVGWIPHFAPPFAQSNYLEIGNLIIYPLPPGDSHPVKEKGPAHYQPRQNGLSYLGIHAFETTPVWSPDMKHIALVDCLYDWKADTADLTTGTESNRNCYIAVVSQTGKSRLVPVEGQEFHGAQLHWTDAKQLELIMDGEQTRLVDLAVTASRQ